MAIMWFSKDGARPHTQSGLGAEISILEIHAIFGSERLHFAGVQAPSINPDTPSHSVKNVVLEISVADGVSEFFTRPGFYLVVGVRPSDAETRLRAHRSAAQ